MNEEKLLQEGQHCGAASTLALQMYAMEPGYKCKHQRHNYISSAGCTKHHLSNNSCKTAYNKNVKNLITLHICCYRNSSLYKEN